MCDFSPDPNARDVLTFDRTYDDILLEAESAKLGDKTCYANTIVCTASSVSNKYSSADDSFKVFQLTEKQTELLLSNSTSFTIKSGPKNENCMVFTEDKSFNIRSSETSNTLLFVSHLHPAKGASLEANSSSRCVNFAPVRHSCKVYYEFSEGRPELSQALNLLRNQTKSDEASDNKHHLNVSTSRQKSNGALNCSGYTFAELCHLVQASEKELKQYLQKLNVMHINEHDRKLRMLSDSYFTDVAMTILRRLEEESYSTSRVPRRECLDCLVSLEPEDVLDFVFDKLFDPLSEDGNTSRESEKLENESLEFFESAEKTEDLLYKLNEKAVCRLFTYYILSGFEKMQLTQFEQVMLDSLPDGVTWNFDYVTDCVITIEAPLKTRDLAAYVKYVPEWELPDDPPEKRLMELWKVKGANGRWTLQQLGPYLLPILDHNAQALTALLTKHARSVSDPSVAACKYFTKKY